jgi:predicted Zn-dependent protease
MTVYTKILTRPSNDPAFYADQAKAFLDQGNPREAQRILDLALSRRLADDFTESIRASVLTALGQQEDAMALRQAKIDAGSNNSVFYADQAKAFLDQGTPREAQRILDLAQSRRLANDFTESIRASVLTALGQHEDAMALRQAKIDAGSNNSAFYNDQAKAFLDQGNPREAQRILDLAQSRRLANDFTESIRASVLTALSRKN